MFSDLFERIPRYLDIIREIKKSYRIYDIHLHPIEIISNLLDYDEVPNEKGLFSLDGGKYSSPSLESLPREEAMEEMEALLQQRPEVVPLLSRRTYSHTGPRVFEQFFDIIGIDKGLQLPVAPADGPIDRQMSVIFRMFKDNSRFSLAGTVPNTITTFDIERFLLEQVEQYRIIAVKIHPNITAINLNSARGKERIDCIIDASAKIGLPVIIHGGRSYLPNKDVCRFAQTSNLKHIELRSSTPVILAHGGAYGLSSGEVLHETIPILKKLLSAHENLFIDIAGLKGESICALLANVDRKRILFGSDALYMNQIIMLTRLISALEKCKLELEESLVQILSKNPAEYIFNESPLI